MSLRGRNRGELFHVATGGTKDTWSETLSLGQVFQLRNTRVQVVAEKEKERHA